MSKDTLKIVLNYGAIRSLLKSNAMLQVCQSHAKKIKNKCGDGYSTHVGRSRVNVSVETSTKKAIEDNSENNTLLKNMR